jgi:hypothetical protein
MYLLPEKYVKIELLNSVAASNMSNIEKILTTKNMTRKGVYLPPKCLKDCRSSLVFISTGSDEIRILKNNEIVEDTIYSHTPDGIFLTPPGLDLSQLLEQKFHKSFIETNLSFLQKELPRLFDEMDIGRDTQIRINGNFVEVELINSVLYGLCEAAKAFPIMHEILGCPLTSAIACVLAKATGNPIVIESESQVNNDLIAEYRMVQE